MLLRDFLNPPAKSTGLCLCGCTIRPPPSPRNQGSLPGCDKMRFSLCNFSFHLPLYLRHVPKPDNQQGP